MLTCPRCGAQCEPEYRYCGKCGQRLVSPKVKETQRAMSVAEIRYKLGLIHYKKGELSDAIQMWRKVLEDDPENSAVRALIKRAEEEIRAEGGL